MCKQNNIKKHKGFTLVELLVTIAILAVLATVSVVGYTQYIEKSAVTTDNFLVKQLNDFTQLYEIEHSGDLEDADIRNLLKNAGLESIELKSEGYEYRLYFDKNNQEFVLATEKKDNYILIDDEFLSAIDSTPDSGNEGTSGEGGDENIQAPGDGNTDDTGSSDGADEPDIVEPNEPYQPQEIFIFNEKYENSQQIKIGAKKYTLKCWTTPDSINLENILIHDTDGNSCKKGYYQLSIEDIINVKDENNNNISIDKIECTPSTIVNYANHNTETNYSINSDNNTISFYKTGAYTLTISTQNKSKYSIQVNVYNANTSYGNPTLTSKIGSDVYNPKFTNNIDGTKNIDLAIFLQISINDINTISMEPIGELDNDLLETLITNGRIRVKIDSEYKNIELSKSRYCVILNNIPNGTHTFTVSIEYMGCNGYTVTLTQNVVLNVTENQIKVKIT